MGEEKMKTKLFYFVWAAIFIALIAPAPAQEQKKETKNELKGKMSSLVISRETPYAETTETVEQLNDSTVKKTTVTTYKTHTLTTRVDASRQSPLGLGGSPQIPELTAGLIAQGNSAVPNAVAGAIDKDPKNIQLLEKAPWPGQANDMRVKIDFGNGFYGYGHGRRDEYFLTEDLLGKMALNSGDINRANEDPEFKRKLLDMLRRMR